MGDTQGDDLVVTCDEIAYTCQRLHRSILITKRTIGLMSNCAFTIVGGHRYYILHESWVINSILTITLVYR